MTKVKANPERATRKELQAECLRLGNLLQESRQAVKLQQAELAAQVRHVHVYNAYTARQKMHIRKLEEEILSLETERSSLISVLYSSLSVQPKTTDQPGDADTEGMTPSKKA